MAKPVPMKLFATWDIDRSSPSCVPRLCTMTITRMAVLKSLGSDVSAVCIAVKMQNIKRILRTSEISLSANGLLDTDLDMSFSLQYPHFIKRDCNRLEFLIQRRKKYKNRAILGFKTLAVGCINLAEILQRPMDQDVELFSETKDKNGILLAKVTVLNVTSQPILEAEADDCRQKMLIDRSLDADIDSEEEENVIGAETSDDNVSEDEAGEYDASGMMQIGRQALDNGEGGGRNSAGGASAVQRRHRRKPGFGKPFVGTNRQYNLKKKFAALLKRFRVAEEDLEHPGAATKISGEMDPQEIEELFEELENLSDSGPEMDNLSISSTPKPSLRPFFSSTRTPENLFVQEPLQGSDTSKFSDESSSRKADSDRDDMEALTDQEQSDSQFAAGSPPKNNDGSGEKRILSGEKKKLFQRDKLPPRDKSKHQLSSLNASACSSVSGAKDKLFERQSLGLSGNDSNQPHKLLLEQLATLFPSEDFVPDHVCLLNFTEPGNLVVQNLSQLLQDNQLRVIRTSSPADVRAVIVCLLNKIQKFCNNNAKAPQPIKVLVAGSDSYVNLVVRPYVDQLSSKPIEWQSYIKFLLLPVGSSLLSKYIGSVDIAYGGCFMDSLWRDTLEKTDQNKSDSTIQELSNRIVRFMNANHIILHFPIAEAVVTYKEKCLDEESSQMLIPFVTEVKIGFVDGVFAASVEQDEAGLSQSSALVASSPPSAVPSTHLDRPNSQITPPSSPNIGAVFVHPTNIPHVNSDTKASPHDCVELQIEYWLVSGKTDSSRKADTAKSTLKMAFRSLQFERLSLGRGAAELTTAGLTMHYVPKEKKQKIMRLGKKKEREEGKFQSVEGIHRVICLGRAQPIKVNIDGIEWNGVKFFQLSSQWQTNVKHFPVAIFGAI